MSHRVLYENRVSAFRNRLQSFVVKNLQHTDIVEFLDDCFHYFQMRILNFLSRHAILKTNACFVAILEKVSANSENGDRNVETTTVYIQSKMETVDSQTDLSTFYTENIMNFMLNKLDDIATNGSGFTLREIVELTVQINKHDPIRGSSFIDLPSFLKNKKAIINVKNTDDFCFLYSILAAKYPVTKNAERVSKYVPYINEINVKGLIFPMTLSQISKFEVLNPTISVNVYMFDEKETKVNPIRLSKNVKETHVHLLLLTKLDGINTISHYCWIKSLSRLIQAQVSRHNHRQYFCDRCMQHYASESKLNSHMSDCMQINDCAIVMPDETNNILKFKKYTNSLKVQFVVYCDLECLLQKVDDKFSESGSIRQYQKHEVFAAGYYLKCAYDDSLSYYRSNRSTNSVKWFVRELHDIARRVEGILNKIVPMVLTKAEEENFKNATHCHICEEKFNISDTRVRDHCHLSGNYRGNVN